MYDICNNKNMQNAQPDKFGRGRKKGKQYQQTTLTVFPAVDM